MIRVFLTVQTLKHQLLVSNHIILVNTTGTTLVRENAAVHHKLSSLPSQLSPPTKREDVPKN